MSWRSKKSISEVELTAVSRETVMEENHGVKELEITHGNHSGSTVREDDTVDAGEDEADIGFKDLEGTGAPNIYVGKRNFIHQLMDVALLMANVSQLKSLLTMDEGDKYFYILLAFICLSIVLQVVFTICMLVIWSIERKIQEHLTETPKENHPLDEKRRVLAERLDKVGNVLVLLIIVSNVFITGFGVEEHGFNEDRKTKAAETILLLSNGTKVKL